MFASVLHWAISVPASLGKDALSTRVSEVQRRCYASGSDPIDTSQTAITIFIFFTINIRFIEIINQL